MKQESKKENKPLSDGEQNIEKFNGLSPDAESAAGDAASRPLTPKEINDVCESFCIYMNDFQQFRDSALREIRESLQRVEEASRASAMEPPCDKRIISSLEAAMRKTDVIISDLGKAAANINALGSKADRILSKTDFLQKALNSLAENMKKAQQEIVFPIGTSDTPVRNPRQKDGILSRFRRESTDTPEEMPTPEQTADLINRISCSKEIAASSRQKILRLVKDGRTPLRILQVISNTAVRNPDALDDVIETLCEKKPK